MRENNDMTAAEQKHIIIYLYYSFRDPLCEGLMLNYLRALKLPGIHFHLVTYEQEKYAMASHQISQTKEDLLKLGITWNPIPYLSGRFFFLKKMASAFRAIRYTYQIKRRHRLSLVCAMATPVGSYVFIASRLFRIPMCQFTFEPHAQIMMQSGRMSANSIKYKVAHWLEMKIGLEAEYVVCTSRHMMNDLMTINAKGKVYRLPTSVDESLNKFDAHSRSLLRKKLNIEDKCVMIYPGKFGGMYRSGSAIHLMTAFLERKENGHVIIITDYPHEEVKSWMHTSGTKSENVTLLHPLPLQELPAFLSAADIGLIAYKDFDVRKYCSPVKTGEYLLCGLPYMVQRGTSEDDEVAEKNHVGVVLETYDSRGLDEKWAELETLMHEDKTQLRARCRQTGITYRGKSKALSTLKSIFENS